MKKIFIYLSFFLITIVANAEKLNQKITVGTKIAEPFVIKNSDGKLTGISFELWNKISDKLNIEYEVKTYDLEGLIDAVSKNEVDIAVSPLTITAEREKILDFTHSYTTTGLSIAIENNPKSSVLNILKNVFSKEFISVVFLIFMVLLLVGFLVWLFERKKNKDQFGDGITKGLGSSFWWAAVTMTTVGYGDKAPQTVGGRIIALVWMFAGLIMISGFTAAIASALTVDQLDFDINGLSDLHNVRVGTVKNSSSEGFLSENGINYITFESVNNGMEGVTKNKIDAFVYDAPILKYFVKSHNISNQIKILPVILNPINYGFALPTGSNLREPVNRILLKEINSKEWNNIINSYLGG
jgi:ABC-type amino acid transport substrate-binding protein